MAQWVRYGVHCIVQCPSTVPPVGILDPTVPWAGNPTVPGTVSEVPTVVRGPLGVEPDAAAMQGIAQTLDPESHSACGMDACRPICGSADVPYAQIVEISADNAPLEPLPMAAAFPMNEDVHGELPRQTPLFNHDMVVSATDDEHALHVREGAPDHAVITPALDVGEASIDGELPKRRNLYPAKRNLYPASKKARAARRCLRCVNFGGAHAGTCKGRGGVSKCVWFDVTGTLLPCVDHCAEPFSNLPGSSLAHAPTASSAVPCERSTAGEMPMQASSHRASSRRPSEGGSDSDEVYLVESMRMPPSAAATSALGAIAEQSRAGAQGPASEGDTCEGEAEETEPEDNDEDTEDSPARAPAEETEEESSEEEEFEEEEEPGGVVQGELRGDK